MTKLIGSILGIGFLALIGLVSDFIQICDFFSLPPLCSKPQPPTPPPLPSTPNNTQPDPPPIPPEPWIGLLINEPEGTKLRGALVKGVADGSPADIVGLRANDIIVSLNNFPLANSDDLTVRSKRLSPGAEITLGVIRNGVDFEVRLKVGKIIKGQS